MNSLLTQIGVPQPGLLAGLACNSLVFTLGYSILRKGLTNEGIAHAWLLGCLSYSAFGPKAYLLLCLYFVMGTVVTKIKMKEKEKEGIAEARQGERGPPSVWGSGIAAAACAFLSLVSTLQPDLPIDSSLMRAGFIASICSKLSDTVSSEIGKAYGSTTYLITTLKLVPRGTEGAVSAEGTLAGVSHACGIYHDNLHIELLSPLLNCSILYIDPHLQICAAVVFSSLAVFLRQVNPSGATVIALAAIVANTFESFLGASIQGRSGFKWLNNDLVNMIQISVAAILAIIGCHLFV